MLVNPYDDPCMLNDTALFLIEHYVAGKYIRQGYSLIPIIAQCCEKRLLPSEPRPSREKSQPVAIVRPGWAPSLGYFNRVRQLLSEVLNQFST